MALRLAAVEGVTAQAAAGNLKAVRAIADGTLERLGLSASPSPAVVLRDRDVPPEVIRVRCVCGRYVEALVGVEASRVEVLRVEVGAYDLKNPDAKLWRTATACEPPLPA